MVNGANVGDPLADVMNVGEVKEKLKLSTGPLVAVYVKSYTKESAHTGVIFAMTMTKIRPNIKWRMLPLRMYAGTSASYGTHAFDTTSLFPNVEEEQRKCHARLADHLLIRITPTPIVPRSRSGSFKRAHSASAFVLNGFESGVNCPPTARAQVDGIKGLVAGSMSSESWRLHFSNC
jgi:hypothetical protein